MAIRLMVLITTERLDRESQDRYCLDLILSDYGKPRLTSNYRLIVNILDNNDHRPKFDQEIYYVDIQENNFNQYNIDSSLCQ